MSVRITGLQEVATLQNGDYIAVDNASNGTHKFDAMKMGANMASNIAPAYSTAATYAIGDFCMHDGILYKCTTAINTPESWTASHWTQTSAGVALAQKVDKVSGKGLSQNDFTNALKTKLDGIASGAEVNVQADWAQTNTSADDYIKNKPVDATSSVGGLMSASDKAKLNGIASGAEVNVQANWTETNTSSDAYIKNKPTNATSSTAGFMSAADKAKLDGIASGAEVNVQADWSQTNTSADDYIKNKPVDATSSVGGLMSATDKAKLDSIEQGAEVNVQANWSQTNTSADDYIKNKPTNATTSTAGLMSASDKTKLNGIETGAQVNVIDGVKVDGTLLTVDGNKDVDIVGKANQASLAPQYSSDTGNYVRGNYVIYQNNLYKCLQDTSGVWDATKWEQVDIGDDLEQKANIDGLYEEMTVGGAEQLISSTFNIESVPYNFRTSGGSLEIGDRETDKLIGGTVAWNQLVKNGDFVNTNNWTQMKGSIAVSNGELTYTISTIGSAYYENQVSQYGLDIPANHVLFTHCETNAPYTNGFYMSARHNSSGMVGGTGISNEPLTANVWNVFDGIGKPSNSVTDIAFYWSMNTSYSVGDSVKLRNVYIIDLTQMFGTTIANYIYSLEQNTAGAGVAFFKKLFPAPYYAYNAGQLMSVNAGSHVMNGFNQWDEVWELGNIDVTTGNNTNSSSNIRSKNYIPVIPSVTYYYKNGTGVNCGTRFYDADKSYINNGIGTANATFTVPADACYMRFVLFSAYGTTYNNDICINIAWDGERNGEYEPYVSHIYELDDTLELRGIPKLDANNQLYYDGDVYESDGNVTRKYGIVDLGTLTWVSTTTNIADTYRMRGTLAVSAKVPSAANIRANIVCAKYANIAATETNEGVTGISIDTGGYVRVYDPSYNTQSSASAFASAISGVYLVYELATPTSESATPYTNPQIVNDWGTETYTDYSYDAQTRDVQIPVGHETRYMANLKAKLEMAPESPNGDGDYIVRQTSGENAYVAIGSSPTIQHKAEIDGTYDDMNVGGAKQLLSNVFEEDQVPYTFRTSGGSIDIGDREYDTVVGGTIAWNQMVISISEYTTDGITITPLGNGSYRVHGTATTDRYLPVTNNIDFNNHVWFLCGSPTGGGTSTTFRLYVDTTSFVDRGTGIIGRVNVTNKRAYIHVSAAYGEIDKIFTPQLFDLTAMFGSTIADYILALETATTGAGVAWFKKLFPKPYYEYNAGELLSVEGVSSHDMTGFNQWDGTGYNGKYWTDTGELEIFNTNCCTNKIKVVAGQTYYFTNPNATLTYKFFDANSNLLLKDNIGSGSTSRTATAPNGADCVAVNIGRVTLPEEFCINLHWDGERDGEYEPYVKHTYALDDSLTLRGIPKLDASNNLYYDGDEYESDGTVTRRYGVVDLGTLNWNRTASYANPFFYCTFSGMKFSSDNGITPKYTTVSANGASNFGNNAEDKTLGMFGANNQIFVRDDSYTDATAFKTAMSGVYLVYELAEPTTETAESFQSPQIVDDFGTEEYVTTSIVPVGHDTKYTANLRAKIEMAPDSPSGNGDYIMRQADGTNSYVPLVIPNELPTMPTTDGNWVLRCTVSSGTATLSWVSAT